MLLLKGDFTLPGDFTLDGDFTLFSFGDFTLLIGVFKGIILSPSPTYSSTNISYSSTTTSSSFSGDFYLTTFLGDGDGILLLLPGDLGLPGDLALLLLPGDLALFDLLGEFDLLLNYFLV